MRTKLFCVLILLGVILSGSGAVAAPVGLNLFAEGFTSPIVLVPLPDGSGRLLVADQIGIIYVVSRQGKVQAQPFLDLRDRLTKLNNGFDERGILGLALHPKFRENRKFYIYYSAPRRKEAPAQFDHTSHISEFTAKANDLAQADPASERLLLEIDKPQFNHNCGRTVFGPDGFLYIGVGDGGAANDSGVGHSPQGNGQDTTKLLGKILRIDVDSGKPYGIPKDNPFADGKDGRPEIFAYGVRNPWGISFDRGGARQLFAADVGQDSFEEINIIKNGGNYGWRIREGFVCFDPKNPTRPPADCPKVGARGEPLLDPIIAYKNFKRFANDPEARGISVTGGYVYRGQELPDLAGKYIFADWSRSMALPDGVLFVATPPSSADGKWTMDTLQVTGLEGGKLNACVIAFGEDGNGELYILTNTTNAITGKTGKVYKLVRI